MSSSLQNTSSLRSWQCPRRHTRAHPRLHLVYRDHIRLMCIILWMLAGEDELARPSIGMDRLHDSSGSSPTSGGHVLLRVFKENRPSVDVVNKSCYIFIYTRYNCSHVETGLRSVYITYFSCNKYNAACVGRLKPNQTVVLRCFECFCFFSLLC